MVRTLTEEAPLLELDGVTKRYGGLAVVRDISFRIRPGELVGYVGRNGAGKSTTIKMIVGLLRPSDGQVRFDGREVYEDIVAHRRRFGYVPEVGEVYQHLSAVEYLELVGRLRGFPAVRLSARIRDLLTLCGFGVEADDRMASYSKGMRQKVLILSALLHDPEILVLDEPFSGLDVAAALVFRDVLRELANRGRIVMLSSHVLEVVQKLCDRIILIDHGSIVADDRVDELRRLMKLPDLDAIFRELATHEDTRQAAADIVAGIRGIRTGA